MSRQSPVVPLLVIALMLLAIMLVLRPFERQSFQAWAQGTQCTDSSTGAAYPCGTTTTGQSTSGTTSTTTLTASAATTTGTARTATVTTATITGTPPTATVSPQITATFAPSETRGPTVVQATSTPVNGAVPCIPGTTVEIKGRGPRNAPLLLYFGGRAVGGGLSDAAGNYRLSLSVGPERAAFYPVEVRVRGTRQLVRELTCLVPYFTPTPTRRPRVPLG
jgi:hypothetical protein